MKIGSGIWVEESDITETFDTYEQVIRNLDTGIEYNAVIDK